MSEYPRKRSRPRGPSTRSAACETHDWPAWADMFTDDARYEEHNLGVFEGKPAITTFIVDIMKEYPAMTLWIEWSIIDGDRIGFYIWNNLPDPTGTGKRYGFPNTTFLQYGGNGKFSFEADYYNPADAERVFKEWLTDGGRRDTPQDRSLARHRRLEPRAAATRVPARGGRRRSSRSTASAPRSRSRPATGTSGPTSSPTTPTTASTTTATSASGAEIRAWIKSVMQPFPTMEFPPSFALIDGNRVSTLIPNILPAARGRRRLLRLRRQHDPPLRRQREVELRGGRVLPRRGAGHRQPVDRRRRRHPVELTTTGLLVVYAKCVRVDEEAAVGRMGGRRAPPRVVRSRPVRGRRRASSSPLGPSPGMPGIGFTHVTILELDDADVAAPGGADPDGRRRTAGRRAHACRARDDRCRRVRRARPLRREGRAVGGTRRGHILTHVLCTDPHRVDEWDAWYDDVHVPDMLCVRRVLGDVALAARARQAVGPNHLTLYDVATDDRRGGGAALGGHARRGGGRRAQARVPHRRADGHAAPDRSPRRRPNHAVIGRRTHLAPSRLG